jgi:transposase
MKLYAGIDLHSNTSMVAIIDEQDRVVLQKRFANALQQILLALASFKQHLLGVVVESTYNWYWRN